MGLVRPPVVAAHHLDAVRHLGNVDIVAVAGSSQEKMQRKVTQLGIAKAYGNYEQLIADPLVQVEQDTTPNHLHLPVGMAAILAGKHIISDQPLAISMARSAANLQPQCRKPVLSRRSP